MLFNNKSYIVLQDNNVMKYYIVPNNSYTFMMSYKEVEGSRVHTIGMEKAHKKI